MEDYNNSLDALVEAVKASPQLKRYKKAVEQVEDHPDKIARLHEFRTKTYELQNKGDTVDMFAEMDRLADSFHDVYQDDIMKEYVNAEIALCKIVQHIEREIIGCLDFKEI
ncbi:MAG: YlbF family regulator [Clostridiales bacterium]|nr:YlbF family regulator [Clostridiales bacterium]